MQHDKRLESKNVKTKNTQNYNSAFFSVYQNLSVTLWQ